MGVGWNGRHSSFGSKALDECVVLLFLFTYDNWKLNQNREIFKMLS